MTTKQNNLGPIERSIKVSWDQKAAFDRFTLQFANWWPSKTHSIGGPQLKRIVFEPFVGGKIFEEHTSGRRFQWGVIKEWDPPRMVRFEWHPARKESTSQQVRVEFTAEGSGTLVKLTSWDWERWGKGAPAGRRMYRMGWGYVLGIFAEQRTVSMGVLDVIGGVIQLIQKARGGQDAVIARSEGEMPAA